MRGLKLYFVQLFCFLIVSMVFHHLNAQDFDGTIVTSSKDTIENVRIIKNSRKTDEKKVSYEVLPGQEFTLTSSNALSYFDGTHYYISKKITNKEDPYFLKVLLNGIVKLFESGADKKLYIQVVDSNEIYSLKDYEFNLDELFLSVIPNYANFKQQYTEGHVYYSKKTVGDLISAYNTFSSPIYRRAEFETSEKIQLGIILSSAFNWLTWDDSYNLTDLNLPFGVFMEIQYNKSIVFSTSIMHREYNFRGSTDDIRISQLTLESYLGWKYYRNPKLTISPGLGASISYNYKGDAYQPLSPIPTQVREFNPGLRFGVDVQYQKKYGISISHHWSQLPMNFGVLADPAKRTATIRSIDIALIYFFR